MNTNLLDQNKADIFADRMLNTLNEGALALMTSLGHRTRLFDVMSGLPPSTSEQIANAAELNERYGIMTRRIKPTSCRRSMRRS
jgi:hypothetical protein